MFSYVKCSLKGLYLMTNLTREAFHFLIKVKGGVQNPGPEVATMDVSTASQGAHSHSSQSQSDTASSHPNVHVCGLWEETISIKHTPARKLHIKKPLYH